MGVRVPTSHASLSRSALLRIFLRCNDKDGVSFRSTDFACALDALLVHSAKIRAWTHSVAMQHSKKSKERPDPPRNRISNLVFCSSVVRLKMD